MHLFQETWLKLLPMQKRKFVILATEGVTTNLLCEELSRHGTVEAVMLEENESARVKIKRRFRKLSFFRVVSQLFFLFFLMPMLSRAARKRMAEIVKTAGFKNQPCDSAGIIRVKSVNDAETVALISKINPDFVFVNGTRIIHKKILDQIAVPVLNIHVGITPKYRGIHGGYWALYRGDAENFGVTLHYVDAGVDTGKIISQKRIKPGAGDNFASYPVLQFIAGLELASAFFSNGGEQVTETAGPVTESGQYYHPGFFQYLFKRWFGGVR